MLTAAEFATVEGMVKGDILGVAAQPDADITVADNFLQTGKFLS